MKIPSKTADAFRWLRTEKRICDLPISEKNVYSCKFVLILLANAIQLELRILFFFRFSLEILSKLINSL